MVIVRSHQLTTDIIEALLELRVGKALTNKDNILWTTFTRSATIQKLG